jgi:hypothetical protein
MLAATALLAVAMVAFVAWRERPRTVAPEAPREPAGAIQWRSSGGDYVGHTTIYADGDSDDVSRVSPVTHPAPEARP